MQLLRYDTDRDVRWVRWLARAFSIVFSGLVLSALLLGERAPTPATIVLAILSAFMLGAWRWEKTGGTLVMLASPFLLISVMYMASNTDANFALALLVGVALTLATLIVGWLFVGVAQHIPMTRGQTEARGVSRKLRILVYGIIALVVIILLALSVAGAPFSEISSVESGVTPGVPRIQVVETAIPSEGE